MATRRPPPPIHRVLRAQLRARLRARTAALGLGRTEAALATGLSGAQLSRLHADEDRFSLDRLVEAAERLGLEVRMTATRRYRRS